MGFFLPGVSQVGWGWGLSALVIQVRAIRLYMCVFVGDGGEVCVGVRACVHACVCVRACVHACVRARRGLSECQGVVSLCVSFTLYD